VLFDIGIPNIRVNKFYMDDENILWAGSKNGIFSINSGGYFKNFTSTNSGLPINDVLAIAKDQNQNIWFGMNDAGLVKYKIWNAK
jgi:ligand-binding sensor domain-containing protein